MRKYHITYAVLFDGDKEGTTRLVHSLLMRGNIRNSQLLIIGYGTEAKPLDVGDSIKDFHRFKHAQLCVMPYPEGYLGEVKVRNLMYAHARANWIFLLKSNERPDYGLLDSVQDLVISSNKTQAYMVRFVPHVLSMNVSLPEVRLYRSRKPIHWDERFTLKGSKLTEELKGTRQFIWEHPKQD